ncbi:unnamed protein product, partial [marine sediment metagenome]
TKEKGAKGLLEGVEGNSKIKVANVSKSFITT